MSRKLSQDFLKRCVAEETGLAFEVTQGQSAEGERFYTLCLESHSADHTFLIRVILEWRRLKVSFEPGKFARDLLSSMASADQAGKAAFTSVLAHCTDQGAAVQLQVNGVPLAFNSPEVWKRDWERFRLTINKGPLESGPGSDESAPEIIGLWTQRMVAAVAAILPLESGQATHDLGTDGYPEGMLSRVMVNRYERDSRNRAAAIALHGSHCKACEMEFGSRYGEVAAGYIEIHHLTPVSQLGPDYVLNPETDLVPLCPNCHAIIHRRNPPFSVADLRKMLARS